MKCAILGLGRAGNIHFNNIKTSSIIKIKYLFDKNISIIEKYNKEFTITDDLDTILYDNEVKIVIISTPTNTHYNLVKICLNHNKHVLCEKPLSLKVDEIEECYNIAYQNNLILLCALNRRFDPTIISLKKKVDSNDLGKIHQINTTSRDYPYPLASYLKISSGIFHDCGVHDIDFVNWILNDKPISVYASGNKIYDYSKNMGTLDNAIIILEYSNKTIVNINLSRISNNYDQRIEVYGISDSYKAENPYSDNSNPISFPERYKNSYLNELNHFINAINCKEPLLITKNDCLNILYIADACEESYRLNKKVTIKYGEGYRNYDNVVDAVKKTYKLARQNQTLEFVKSMHNKYLTFKKKMTLNEVFKALDSFIDISDPDISLPNFYHGIQTAEAIRKDNHPEWLQLVGLIHDIGKIIYLWGCDEDGTSIKNQWGIVGDTFIVGCKLPNKIVYPEFNRLNMDMNDVKYNTPLGIYRENCGLNNVMCSWGHDEYLYQVLKHNKVKLPDEALYIIRFHSLYSYHKHNEYKYFTNDYDAKMYKWLKLFNKYDLYTKSDDNIYNDECKEYYNNLINKYINNGFLYF